MAEITIRKATIADAALIADMSRESFAATFAAGNKPEDIEIFLDQQFTKAALMAEVGTPGNTFLIAFSGDEPAGYVRLRKAVCKTWPAENPLEIARLYAMPEMVGKGVGKFMMTYCIDFASANGHDLLWLGVWEHNARAIHFYQSFGFEKVATQDFLLGNDLQTDWVMKREIQPNA